MKKKIVPLILTILQSSHHIRIMHCQRATLRYDLITRNIRKSKIYSCTLKSSSRTQICQFYVPQVPHVKHAYFSPSNQPIKFSILLNDPTLTSLSYNKVKLVLTGCPSFPLRPARPLNPDDPLHEKKNVIIKLLMTGKFKSKFITSRCRYLPVLLWVPSVPGVPSFLAIPGKKLNT